MVSNIVRFGIILEDFHKIIRERYPDLTLEHLREVCVAPYNVLRDEFLKEDFNPVRIRY